MTQPCSPQDADKPMPLQEARQGNSPRCLRGGNGNKVVSLAWSHAPLFNTSDIGDQDFFSRHSGFTNRQPCFAARANLADWQKKRQNRRLNAVQYHCERLHDLARSQFRAEMNRAKAHLDVLVQIRRTENLDRSSISGNSHRSEALALGIETHLVRLVPVKSHL